MILFVSLTVFHYAQADVMVKLTQPPPNQLRAADLWKLTLDNTDTSAYRIRLEGTLDEADAGRVADGTSGVITLPRGRKTITYDDVKRGGTVNFKAGKWRDAFTRTGNAPSGDYTICITVKSEAGDELGKDCIQQQVQITSPPTLISPADGDTLPEGQPLIFTWLPPAPASSDETYELKIVEVQGNQSPEEAMKKNAALFEKKDIRTTTLQYPASARKPEKGWKLVWAIRSGGVWSDMFALQIVKAEIVQELQELKEYLIIESKDNPELEYAYVWHSKWKTFKHNLRKSPSNPFRIPKLSQSDLDNIDYSKITLQALDGDLMGVKFIHASSNTYFPVSSWVLPNEPMNNDMEIIATRPPKHGRLRSWYHDVAKTECDTVTGGRNSMPRRMRLINKGNNDKEGVVSYELKENGKYGFKLHNNLITQEELEKIKYKEITFLDLDESLTNSTSGHRKKTSIHTPKHCFLISNCEDK
jgi:hypothetical protein